MPSKGTSRHGQFDDPSGEADVRAIREALAGAHLAPQECVRVGGFHKLPVHHHDPVTVERVANEWHHGVGSGTVAACARESAHFSTA